MNSLAKIVSFHRKQSGLSRNRLAEIAGVGKTVIYDIEHGKERVRYQTLLKVLTVLNIKLRFESPLMAIFEANNHEKS
jgi:transcriptional regulator with XRE-family HTH domain